MDRAWTPRARAAVLIFADSQQRDLRRRSLPSSASSLLALPKLSEIAECGLADLHWFTDRPASSLLHRGDIQVHRQHGRGFGRRLENAIDKLATLGYDRIVIVGRDCPQLTAGD